MSKRKNYILGSLLVLVIVLCVLVGPLQAQDDASQEMQNIELTRQFFDRLNQRDFSENFIGEFYAPSWIVHAMSSDRSGPVDQRMIQAYEELSQAFPDYVFTIENIAATGDTVMVHYTFAGTFEGDWYPWGGMGLCTATNEEVSWEGVYVRRLEDGLVQEEWHYLENPLVINPDRHCGQ